MVGVFSQDEMIRICASMRTDLNEKRAALFTLLNQAPETAERSLADALNSLTTATLELSQAVTDLGGRS